MESKIEKLVKKYKIPGCSITIIKNYKILLSQGFGKKNFHQLADINTQFQAGSISKPIFALCVMLLIQSGKISLTQDISKYFKKFNIMQKITLEQLLSHTAGINVHGFPGYNRKEKIPTLEQVIQGEGNTDEIYQKYIPGLKKIYSGGGTCLAQYAIEKITGMKLDKLADKLLFKPLGLNCTYSQTKKKTNYSVGENIKDEYHIYPEQAAAGLWCSSSDLAIIGLEICHALKGKSKIFSKKIIQKMLTPVYKYDNDGNGVGIAWMLEDYVFGHTGVDAGFTAKFDFNQNGSGCVIMTNTNSNTVWEFFNKIHKLCDSIGIDIKYEPMKKNKIPNLKKLVGNYRGLNNIVKIHQPKDHRLWMKIGDFDVMIRPFNNDFIKFYYSFGDLKIVLEFRGKKLKIIQDLEESEFEK